MVDTMTAAYDALIEDLLRPSQLEDARPQRFFYVVLEQDISGGLRRVLATTRSRRRVIDVVVECREEGDGYAIVLVVDESNGQTIRTTVMGLTDYPESERCVPQLSERSSNRCFVIITNEKTMRGFVVVREPSMLRTLPHAISMHGPYVIEGQTPVIAAALPAGTSL
jgi:hypothetical protein